MCCERLLRLALSAAVMVTIACGRKLDPLPPIIEVPETTTDLRVHQEALEVVLEWSYPSLTRGGRQLVDLARIEVWRLDLAPGQEQIGAGPGGEELRRQLMLSRGKLVARLEGPTLEAATRGSRLRYAETLPDVQPGSASSTFWYAVRSRRRDGTNSALSNIATWQMQPVPALVRGLVATPRADGIALSWESVAGASYVVERRSDAGGAWQVIAPLSLSQASYLDEEAAQGQTWRYRVRSLQRATAGPIGDEVVVPYPDTFPPAAVAALLCLPESGAVRLRWDQVAEPGVSYQVSRRRPGGEWEEITGAGAATETVDAAAGPGEVEYAVRAVDKAGNRSEPTQCSTRVEP